MHVVVKTLCIFLRANVNGICLAILERSLTLSCSLLWAHCKDQISDNLLCFHIIDV